ncbi:MAG TPA: zf-HC2 domain-containing protein [Acidimicrobiia bacterium]|nr:zf-HC2 domain-containing protein [Acidimicrobiia bacterium]
MTEREFGCSEVRDLAPELALGVLAGPERAEAILHVDRCPACRAHVAELSDTVDALTLLAPEAEPPTGFERNVLRAMGVERAHGWRRFRPPRWAAAAALVCALATGSAVGGFAAVGALGTHHDRLHDEYVQSLRALGGTSLRAAPMLGAGGRRAGEVFAYQGKPSWVYVSVDYWVPGGTYQVVVDGPNGARQIGQMQVVGGHGSWGGAAPTTVGQATAVRLLDHNGKMQCEARLTT